MDKGDIDSSSEKRDRGGIFGFFTGNRHQRLSEDELKDAVTEADELQEDEKRMIREIIDLGTMTAREIMTPRVDMILAEECESIRTVLERMRGTGYSRLPVYRDDTDNVVGIIHYKDLIGAVLDGRTDESIAKYMYEPLFVPETKDAFPLLSEMQAARHQMAIVVDEYGGTDGLITVEDIVEEIVGEIADETDLDQVMLAQIGPNRWRVRGSLPIEDALEMGWPVADSDDYETIAGWLMSTLDSVPETGDEFDVDGYSFTIERMRRSRIAVIRVEKLPEPAAEAAE